MKIHVIGTGYVGLVSALSFAKSGNFVKCWDINESIVESLNRGKPHFHENGLEDLLAQQIAQNNILFHHADNYTIDNDTEIIFIAVGTPTTQYGIDLSYIKGAFNMIGKSLLVSKATPSIVVKSTVLPGTTKDTSSVMLRDFGLKRSNIGVGMCPEFLREGCAISDSLNPDRIVIGYEDNITKERLVTLFSEYDCPIIHMNTATAEFSKYCNNSYLALQISMANALSNVALIDPTVCLHDALSAVYSDKRWSGSPASITSYMYPGCGFGGSCFPKDVKALNHYMEDHGFPSRLLESIITVNENQARQSLLHINDWLNDQSLSIGILGFSFKPDTDDFRETPALAIIKNLLKRGFKKINVHDPLVDRNSILNEIDEEGKIKVLHHLGDIVKDSRILILVTAWSCYNSLSNLQCENPEIKLFDTRSFLGPESFEIWEYRSLARKERCAQLCDI